MQRRWVRPGGGRSAGISATRLRTAIPVLTALLAAGLPVGAQDGPAPAPPTPPTPPSATPKPAPAAPTVRPATAADLVILREAKLKPPRPTKAGRPGHDPVVDGDTIKVEGIRRSLRLILIDTEEIPHQDTPPEDIALMKKDFEAYREKMKARDSLPVKYATPLGDEATRFAAKFCREAKTLRLERDAKDQGTGNFGRTLCYVWAEYGDGRPPALYNLEVVRQGLSPYYVKYGRSKRFDAAFRAAQAEARAAHRGIWDPKKQHYDDYDVRLAWWGRRADALDRYAALAARKKGPIFVRDRNAIRRLLRRVGKEVFVFGLVDDHDPNAVRFHEDGATLRIGGRYAIEIEVVGTELAGSMSLKALRGEFIAVRGTLDRLGSPLGGRSKNHYMRIPVKRAEQVIRGDQLPTE